MIDLYSWKTSNGKKASIMLEECGLDYNIHPIHIGQDDQFTPEYTAINPNGKIPAIIDQDGPGSQPYTVIESGAILMYLAEKTGKFMPQDMAARYEVIQWLMFQMGGIGPMQGQAHVFYRYAPEKIEYAIERYQKETLRLYTVLDTQLKEHEYLTGDLSIADIATWPWVRSYRWAGLDIENLPHLQRWLDVLAKRPAFQQGIEVPYKIDRSKMTAEQTQEKGSKILI